MSTSWEALDQGPGSLHSFGLTSMTLHMASATIPKARSLPRDSRSVPKIPQQA